MIRRPPRSTRTDTLFPYTTLFRSSQDSVSALLQVFIMTNRFKPNERQYCPSASLNLPIPTSDTLLLQNAAMPGLNAIYRPGFKYKRSEERRVGKECVS